MKPRSLTSTLNMMNAWSNLVCLLGKQRRKSKETKETNFPSHWLLEFRKNQDFLSKFFERYNSNPFITTVSLLLNNPQSQKDDEDQKKKKNQKSKEFSIGFAINKRRTKKLPFCDTERLTNEPALNGSSSGLLPVSSSCLHLNVSRYGPAENKFYLFVFLFILFHKSYYKSNIRPVTLSASYLRWFSWYSYFWNSLIHLYFCYLSFFLINWVSLHWCGFLL